MKERILLIVFGIASITSFAQTDLGYHWKRLFGSPDAEMARCLAIKTNGDNIVAGYTTMSEWFNHGGKDIYIGKADQSGVYKWAAYYGGTLDEEAYSISNTLDNGFIIAGYTTSNDDEVSGNHGGKDTWVIKTSSTTAIEWQKCYGGTLDDEARTVQQTSDGGYIISGYTKSTDGDITSNHGSKDCWLIKIGSDGIIDWQKTYGGSFDDEALCVQQTVDGGYIFAGSTISQNGDVTVHYGVTDYWVVKTDENGVIQWQKSYGGTVADEATGILQTTDGGYIITGSSKSYNYDVTLNHGGFDYWIVKINSTGEIEWQKTYGGSLDDISSGIQKTSNGGYVVAGSTKSGNGDITFNHGDSDYWVILINESGLLQSQESFGGSGIDVASAVKVASDGNCVVVGTTNSPDGDVGNTGYDDDIWALETCATFPTAITIADPNYCRSTSLIGPDGFAYYSWSTGETTKSIEIDDGGEFSLFVSLANGCKSIVGIEVPDPTYYGDEPIAITRSFYNCDTVSLTATDGFESYIWNTNQSGQTIKGVPGRSYWVRGTNVQGCSSHTFYYTAPTDTLSVQHQICFITMDEQIEKNVIEIQKPFNLGVEKVNLFRMVDTSNIYEKIAEFGPENENQFVDLQSDPNHHSYTYRLMVNDICGRENFNNSLYNSIFLVANIGENNKVMLNWNSVLGFSDERVNVYRSNAGGPFQIIGDFPGNVYSVSDLNPPPGINRYQVRYYIDLNCSQTKSTYGYVGSNIVQTGVDGIHEDMLSSFEIYPNPFINTVNIKFSGATTSGLVEIFNSAGIPVYSFQEANLNKSIDLSMLKEGLYCLKITSPAKTATLKIMKLK
ncbi:MAG: T9SS type A sorting domain-containing protein [Bacteroidales bacterium]|nr:T9SS type A sorting domain-containing protein [Bacteroidales bacterium]